MKNEETFNCSTQISLIISLIPRKIDYEPTFLKNQFKYCFYFCSKESKTLLVETIKFSAAV